MSISLMFGRLGAVAGSNFTAILLDDHCEIVFYLAGSVLLGKKYAQLPYKNRFK